MTSLLFPLARTLPLLLLALAVNRSHLPTAGSEPAARHLPVRPVAALGLRG